MWRVMSNVNITVKFKEAQNGGTHNVVKVSLISYTAAVGHYLDLYC